MNDEFVFDGLSSIGNTSLYFDDIAPRLSSHNSNSNLQLATLQTTMNNHEQRLVSLENRFSAATTLSSSISTQLRTISSSSSPNTSSHTPNSPMLDNSFASSLYSAPPSNSANSTSTTTVGTIATNAASTTNAASSTSFAAAVAAANAVANANNSSSNSGGPCVLAGCYNRTGFGANYHPKDICRHVKSRSHVEAMIGFSSYSSPGDILFCGCPPEDYKLVSIDLVQSLGTQRNEGIADFFTNCTQQQACQNKVCLRLYRGTPANTETLLDAQRRAKAFVLAAALNDDGSKKRRRTGGRKRNASGTALLSAAATTIDDDDSNIININNNNYNNNNNNNNNQTATSSTTTPLEFDDGTMRGDQTVAIEFGKRFSTPGLCYIVLDAATNQLLVQQERPSRSLPMFHVAHVARMHRWMEKVIHYAPGRHEFWNTHVAVADSGYVDAFVLVHPNVPVRPNATTGELDAQTRFAIQEHVACDEWLLCAGRSDGWLELIRREDLAVLSDLIPLPLSHLLPHTIRVYNSNARPSLMLLSTNAPAPLQSHYASSQSSSQFDIRLQHYLPSEVKSTSVKLEMLCKCSGWHLIAHRPSKLSNEALLEFRDNIVELHSNAASTLEAFDALVELDASTRCAAEAVAARSRAIACIAESDAMRRSNAELRRRLASVEKQLDERVAAETASIKLHNEQLQLQLVDLKKHVRDAKATSKKLQQQQQQQQQQTTTPSPSVQHNKLHQSIVEQQFAPSNLTSQKQINQWMHEHPDRQFVLYRRHDKHNSDTNSNSNSKSNSNEPNSIVALCVRTASNELVHSRIKRTTNGMYCCVREVCAQSLDELLHLLQLRNASPTTPSPLTEFENKNV